MDFLFISLAAIFISPIWALTYLKYISIMHEHAFKEKKFAMECIGKTISEVIRFAEREAARTNKFSEETSSGGESIGERIDIISKYFRNIEEEQSIDDYNDFGGKYSCAMGTVATANPAKVRVSPISCGGEENMTKTT